MHTLLKKISLVFSAGALGGLVNALAVTAYQTLTATSVVGIKISGGFSPELVYHHVVWGGIWGAFLLVPMLFQNIVIRGLVYSLGPTLIQLFVIMPASNQGLLGLAHGKTTPVEIIVFNIIWGLGAVVWLKLLKEK